MHGPSITPERGLILLVAAGLLACGAVMLWPPRPAPVRPPDGPMLYEDVAVVAPTFRTVGKIDVNAASVEDLTRLPGIGEVLATRIVAFREANGPFARLDDLTAVSGIGPQTVERLRDFASAGGEDESPGSQ